MATFVLVVAAAAGGACSKRRDASACLRHLHDFLLGERAARAVVHQIIARCGIGQPHDEVVHTELSAHGERRSYLRDWLSACGVLRSGLIRFSAYCKLPFNLKELSAHCERRSDLQRLSAHCELRSDLRELSAHNVRRSDLKCILHGSSLGQRRRGCVQRRCGARLQRSRNNHSTRDARCAL